MGFGGLLDKIRSYREVNRDKKPFYDAEEKVVLSVIEFIQRHINRIEELIQRETRPEILETLNMMLQANKSIKLGVPRTFLEACQWIAYFNCISRIYTRDGAGFQMDVLLKPYYENDLKNGILNDDTTKFIIANLLLIDTHYYQVSGVDENDNDIANPLSYLILDAANDINISANLTVRVHKNCDENFLYKAIEYLFKNKNGWPRFCGDDSLVNGYMKNGIDKKTAHSRIAVGCNWMCVPGREFPMNDTVKINIAKVLEVALRDLEKEKEKSTDKLFMLFEKHLTKAVNITAKGVNLHIDHQWEVTPELVMNLMMKNTIEKGLDISQCAELYTVGVDGSGLAVVADSFGALEQRIEKERMLSWQEVFECLNNNFEGVNGERIRNILLSSQKYCQGDSIADAWAKRIADSFTMIMKQQSMPEGRQLIPGWFSWSRTIEYGSKVGATPNGRKNGEPISHGANPNSGFRKDGAVTAMATGIAKTQPGYGNTAPFQLEFDPQITIQDGGVKLVAKIIRTHFDMGGTLININILDSDKLMAAHENPDLYPDLVVRVTGFTAYFATLSPEFRQLVIDRLVKGF